MRWTRADRPLGRCSFEESATMPTFHTPAFKRNVHPGRFRLLRLLRLLRLMRLMRLLPLLPRC